MRSLLRKFVESARRWSATGAAHNARLEVETTSRTVVDLERQLARVSDNPPPQAA